MMRPTNCTWGKPSERPEDRGDAKRRVVESLAEYVHYRKRPDGAGPIPNLTAGTDFLGLPGAHPSLGELSTPQ